MASWTGLEIKRLHAIYSTAGSPADICRALPRHTWGAIKEQAQKQKLRRPTRKTGWLKDEVENLKVMYPDVEVTKERILTVLSRHNWRSIQVKASALELRRPRKYSVVPTAHPLVKKCAQLIQAAKMSPVAVFQEAGRGPDAAWNVYRGRTDPRLTDFDRVLREIGMRLSIVAVGAEP